jgi:hypothetical protein
MLWSVLFTVIAAAGPALPAVDDARTARQPPAAALRSPSQETREQAILALRQRARARMEAEAVAFSAAELADIEARYASAYTSNGLFSFLRLPGAEQILEDLVQRYPRANRSGCSLLQLAQQTSGARREAALRRAIRFDGDAWFENGVQVAALARALLAVHLAGLDRFDEAEQVAAELVTRFPGAIDQTGATLDDTLAAIKLLRGREEPWLKIVWTN